MLGGYEVGKRLAELIGNTGKVYMNTTNPDASSVTGRRDGFLKAMKEFPDIEVVGIDYNLDVQETAQRQTAAVLQKHPDLKGIFGTNLFSAQGAYQAVDNAGLSGEVKIASWDATPDLIQALKDGKVDLVLAQRPYQIGQLAVEWGYKYPDPKGQGSQEGHPRVLLLHPGERGRPGQPVVHLPVGSGESRHSSRAGSLKKLPAPFSADHRQDILAGQGCGG